MSSRYHIQRYINIVVPAAGAADFPISIGHLQDPTLATTPAISVPSNGVWQGFFTKEAALENIQLWIAPKAAVNWKVQINGVDNAVAAATTGMPLAKNVFTLAGPIPMFDLVLNCNLANAGAATTVSVWWVGLSRNPMV